MPTHATPGATSCAAFAAQCCSHIIPHPIAPVQLICYVLFVRFVLPSRQCFWLLLGLASLACREHFAIAVKLLFRVVKNDARQANEPAPHHSCWRAQVYLGCSGTGHSGTGLCRALACMCRRCRAIRLAAALGAVHGPCAPGA